jgi:hypothetical protein
MSQKYQIILINGQVQIEADDLQVDEKGHLCVYGHDPEMGDPKLMLQVNARHWVSWMFSDGPPKVIPVSAIPPIPPFGRKM